MRTERPARWRLLVVLQLFVFTCVLAQEGGKEQTIVPMKGGFFVAFTTKAPGANGWSTTSAEALFESNTIRRVFVDSGGSLYFGYALVVEPLAAAGQFRVSVRPLSPEDETELRARKTFQGLRIHPSYSPEGLSRSAAPQVIADGDAFALDVLVNPRTGEKITDYVAVSSDEATLREATTAAAGGGEPRDFTLADVELKVSNYQLLVNGELVAAAKRAGAVSGPVIWFHLEGRGRFIFSPMPHAGYDFRKIGTIERNRMKFTLGGERYEWVSDAPVIGAGGNWNLYVLHDPGYVPDSFFLGVRGAARAEKRDSPSRLKEIEDSLRLPQDARPAGFGRPPGPRKADEPEKAPPLRLIIGASSRVENLLPKN